ncbi:MAG: GGDEF domain-containing protein [Roseovarius sp.]|nr:GGDEF domain-containing protein [Roseovarius sp.]
MSAPDPDCARFLDVLCPMHAVLDRTGHVVHAGPTLHKLAPDGNVTGRRFLELLELRRPRAGDTLAELRAAAGEKLHFRLRPPPRTELKGVLMPLPAALAPEGGLVVNLSFGISVLDAVGDFALTSGDFAATDLAIEMLYLVEAKSAAMEASRKLNARLQGARIAAEERAFTDTLTGLANRRALSHVMERLAQTDQDFVVMTLDLDRFKIVNDSLGHAAGDHVLREVAQRMRAATRDRDTIVRTGGDEFVLIFAGLVDREKVREIAARLISQLERPIAVGGETCRISASIGAALSCDYGWADPRRIMTDADAALYTAKNAGRGCHRVHRPPGEAPLDRSG